MGFIKVANETMCRPIRALTQMKGYDVAAHALACFGGAGGQHACAIARSLGMKTIFIHRYSGILSAVGIGLADVVAEEQVCNTSLGCILSAVGIGLADVVAEEQVCDASVSCILSAVGIGLADVVAEEQVCSTSLGCIHTVLLQSCSALVKSSSLHTETWVGGVRLCQVCCHKVFYTSASSVQGETLLSGRTQTEWLPRRYTSSSGYRKLPAVFMTSAHFIGVLLLRSVWGSVSGVSTVGIEVLAD